VKAFAHLLGKYLEISGMKQTHIASTANISYNYLQRLLAGDRNPSDQVVSKLAQALHLTPEETGALFVAAGYAPPVGLLQSVSDHAQADHLLPVPSSGVSPTTRLTQQLYRLIQDIPEALHASFFEEIKHFLGYARYKYVLSKGANVLDLERVLLQPTPAHLPLEQESPYPSSSSFQLLAQLIGELHQDRAQEPDASAGDVPQSPQVVEDMLSAIDTLTGTILTGEITMGHYQPDFIVQTLDLLREGAPWEIRRRITEALPGLCQLDVSGAERLMEALRLDSDEVRGPDIRRRVLEALPSLVNASALALPVALQLLHPKPGDDTYVALTTVEVCGDIQAQVKQHLEREPVLAPDDVAGFTAFLREDQSELAKIQRQLLSDYEGVEREALQFSLALHDLLCAPDTLLLSLHEGLQSPERLLQWVAIRYVERVLDSRPMETLELYKMVLKPTMPRNVRRTVAKALPAILHCLKESSLPTRTLARSVIRDLADDSDLYVRRAVADHAMQLFHIDREFLLIVLRHMQKDPDPAIRRRLQPVALRLAEVWLVWYAETAGLVDTKQRRQKTLAPFGEEQ
jgi:transcriptional regulator with XRE-family HTH domain